jgi:hypothetical protein
MWVLHTKNVSLQNLLFSWCQCLVLDFFQGFVRFFSNQTHAETMKTVTTRSGRKMPFDEQRWSIQIGDPTCQIIGEQGDDYLLLDANALLTPVPKSIIHDNHYEIQEDLVTLSAGVYVRWITSPRVHASYVRTQELYAKHRELLFRHRALVLSRAEYYLLAPRALSSGAAYMGGFNYSLGALFDAMEQKAPGVYFEELAGHRDLFLVTTAGSPLSGVHNSTFWSEEQGFLSLSSSDCRLPGGFLAALRAFKAVVERAGIGFTFQDKALKQLLRELGVEV